MYCYHSIMRSCVALVLLVLVAQAAESSLRIRGSPLEERITNGTSAETGQFPYQADILTSTNHTCTGTLISNEWVITDAVCVYSVESVDVTLGMTQRSAADEDRVTVTSSEIIIHSEYDFAAFRHEIAAVKLSIPVNFTDTIQPAMLPRMSESNDSFIGTNVTVSGWGSISDWDFVVPTDMLQYVILSVTSNDVCSSVFGGWMDDDKLCCAPNPPINPCRGDDGGPLIADDGSGPKLLGFYLNANFDGCDNSVSPTFYVRMTSYLDWIQQTTGIEIQP